MLWGPFDCKDFPNHNSTSIKYSAVYKALLFLFSRFILSLPQRVAGSGVLESAAIDLLGPMIQFTFGEIGPDPQIGSSGSIYPRKLANATDQRTPPVPHLFFLESWWVNIYHIPPVGEKGH